MKGMLFIIPLMIIGVILYVIQSEKVNKDMAVDKQVMRVEVAKFDADFDQRWGDKSADEMAQNKAKIQQEESELIKVKTAQMNSENERESQLTNIKKRLNNELDNQNQDENQPKKLYN
jgi:hypothetical protein